MGIPQLFDTYKAELGEDLQLDVLNLKEQQLKLPGVRHKWVGRLMQHKRDLAKLKKARKQTLTKLVDRVKDDSVVELSKVALVKRIETLPDITDLDDAIEECETMILYLEKVETIFKSTSFDIKNIIEIQKLETL